MDRILVVVVCSALVLSAFALLVVFPPGFNRYGAYSTDLRSVVSSFSIPPYIASDLYRVLGPVVGLRVYSPYGVSESTIFLAPYGVAGVVPGIHQEPSTVFEMSLAEYNHWCRRASELSMGYKPKAIYLDAVLSFLFDVKVRPVWKKARLVVLATRYAAYAV